VALGNGMNVTGSNRQMGSITQGWDSAQSINYWHHFNSYILCPKMSYLAKFSGSV